LTGEIIIARCFKVTVKTTNARKNTTYGVKRDGFRDTYVSVSDNILYVINERPSDVEKLIDFNSILKIEEMGIGYVKE
jgi:hypothetical protein